MYFVADFLSDTMEDAQVTCIRLAPADLHRVLDVRKPFNLDFDDAYQYAAAEKHSLQLVSFDGDFDRSPRGTGGCTGGVTPAPTVIYFIN